MSLKAVTDIRMSNYFQPMRWLSLAILFLLGACTEPLPIENTDYIESVNFSFLQEENSLFMAVGLSNDNAIPDDIFIEWYATDLSNQPDTITLYDDGSNGDIIANDNVWSREMLNIVGSELSLIVSQAASDKVYLTGKANENGIQHSKDGEFSLGNIIPVILSITAPDTVSLPPSASVDTTFLVECEVFDANGADDIRRVSFKSYLAENDSIMNNGVAIELVDDGGASSYSGDKTADDQIYSITVRLPNTAATGSYRWVFQAQDQSLAYSIKDTHMILVEPSSP